jgi:hypothetical protein
VAFYARSGGGLIMAIRQNGWEAHLRCCLFFMMWGRAKMNVTEDVQVCLFCGILWTVWWNTCPLRHGLVEAVGWLDHWNIWKCMSSLINGVIETFDDCESICFGSSFVRCPLMVYVGFVITETMIQRCIWYVTLIVSVMENRNDCETNIMEFPV